MKNSIKTWSTRNVYFLLALVSISSAILPGFSSPFERKAYAENVHSPELLRPTSVNQMLEAPPIKQGRAINAKYSRMETPTVEAFSHEDGSGTGYLNVTWEPVENATKYQG